MQREVGRGVGRGEAPTLEVRVHDLEAMRCVGFITTWFFYFLAG